LPIESIGGLSFLFSVVPPIHSACRIRRQAPANCGNFSSMARELLSADALMMTRGAVRHATAR